MSSISSSQSTGFPIFLKKDEIRVICFSFPVSQERFSSLFLIIFLCSSIRLTQLILLKGDLLGRDISGATFF
jgi:hypothetical protein